MNVCAYCGRENISDAAFCRECGKEFAVTPPPALTQVPAEDRDAVFDRLLGLESERRPKAVLGWISLALSSSWLLAGFGSLLLLSGPRGPDDITGGLGVGGLIASVLAVVGVITCVGVITGIFGLRRSEKPKWPAIVGVVVGGVPAGFLLLGFLRHFFVTILPKYLVF